MQPDASPRLVSFAIALIAALHPPQALAEQPTAADKAVHWQCAQEYDEYYEILCLPRVQASDVAGAFAVRPLAKDPYWDDVLGSPSGAADQAPHTLNTTFRGRDMRPVAARGAEEVQAPGGWRVPLFARPTDPPAIVALLQQVLCGSAAGCTVRYGTVTGLTASR